MDLIIETEYGNNFAYILNDNSIFSLTEYKVLQNQVEGSFVKCMKLLYNGKVQLYYLTNEFKPLKEMLHLLDSKKFMMIVSYLLNNIITVKKIGFLSCQNIDISFEHIFVNPSTYEISLVYLPIGKRLYHNLSSFENELRTNLIDFIQNTPSICSSKVLQFATDLSNDMLSLESLYDKTKEIANISHKRVPTAINEIFNREKSLKLVSVNAPVPFEIIINKDEFIIGRKQELVDGMISFNRKVGRAHCKIVRQANHYAIIDLQSSNGTYVNRVRLQSSQPCPIKDGDNVRLADSEFKVVIS